MRRTRVHIGTTEGPAEIQRLTPEPPEIRSVVCLDGRAVALPISRDYDGFVRRPTGVVERIWGGQAFRMDVGARITDGLSWQLGAFIAHALHAAGALAGAGDDAAMTVWATGEVDAAIAVRPVDEIPRKLELSADLLRGQSAVSTWVMVPAAAAGLARETLARLGLAGHCEVVGVTDGAEALAVLGLALPGSAPVPGLEPTPVLRPRSRRRPVAAAVLAIGLLAASVAGWVALDWRRTARAWTDQAESGDLIGLDQALSAAAATPSCLTCGIQVRRFRSWLAAQSPDDGAPDGGAPDGGAPVVAAEETRRMASGGCAPTSASPPTTRATLTSADAPNLSVGVCRVRYVVSGAPAVALFVGMSAPQEGADSMAVGKDAASVVVEIPPLSIYPSEVRIVALASRLPLEPTLAWLRPQLPPPPAAFPAALEARLATLGVAARELRHRIEPGRRF